MTLPEINISHFEYCALFAFFSSIVLGIVSKRKDRERWRYAVKCFAYFMIAVFGLGWLMYLGHG
jgi:ABC-type dipeptide/oligopeptide/nickel transport system permease component